MLKLGLDLKGGVHLVLRVADRRCAADRERDRDGAAARDAARRPASASRNIALVEPDAVQGRGHHAGAGRGVPPRRPTRSARISIATRASNGTYTFTMKPNVAGRRCAKKRSCRRARRSSAASTSSASPSRASRSRARTATRSSCSCPASPTSTARRRSSARPGLLELKIVEQGPSASKEALLVNGQRADGHGSRAGRRQRRRCGRRTVYYLVRKAAAVTGRDLRSARPSLDENNRPAVSFTLNSEGAAKFGKVTGENIGRAAGHHPRRPRAVGAAHRRRASPATAASPAASRRRKSQNLSLILRSGSLPATLDLPRGATIGPSLGADSIRSGVHRLGRRPAADHRVHARLLQGCRA